MVSALRLTTPLWTTLYDLIVLRNKPSPKFWLGFVLSALGTWLIVMGGSGAGTAGAAAQQINPAHIGEILAAIGGIAFAFYLVAIRAVTEKYSTLTMITRTYSWSAVFLWIAALVSGEALPGGHLQSWGGILAMALISQSFGHTCLNISLKSFAPRIVALSTLLEPVIAGILASILFGEVIVPADDNRRHRFAFCTGAGHDR
jgi:drug/metabolite transporter (DMT)-like permease